MVFTITHEDTPTRARTGILKTKSGTIETPFFMPVATKTAAKYISPHDLESMQAKAIICNAYMLSLRPGARIIKECGGIAKFMSFPGIVFTDSGGFQMYTKSLYLKSDDDGVFFRNPYSGEHVFMTPEENMKTQLALGSDVALCLDSMPLIEESKEAITEAVRKTGLWAQRCKKTHDALQASLPLEKRHLLFGIIQGGVHKELRQRSCNELLALSFDGYAIGGLALGEPKEQEYAMIDTVKAILPKEKPVYIMGIGNPPELLEAVARGCDMFDSRFPTKIARHGTLFTLQGKLRLTNAAYAADTKPLDPSCGCLVCQKYSRAYIRHLLLQEEAVGLYLASYHNLYFLQALMREAKAAIKAGMFAALKERIAQAYAS